jgi:hypothetical protein
LALPDGEDEMNRGVLKGFCVAFGLLCFAAGAAAQDNAINSTDEFTKQMGHVFDGLIISPDRISRAEDDIAKMDEPELRSLAGVLNDCNSVLSMTREQALGCQSALAKYLTEYGRARAIDASLYMFSFASSARSGGATTFSFNFTGTGKVTIEDIMRALKELPTTNTRSTLTLADVEEALRRKVTETIKGKTDSR